MAFFPVGTTVALVSHKTRFAPQKVEIVSNDHRKITTTYYSYSGVTKSKCNASDYVSYTSLIQYVADPYCGFNNPIKKKLQLIGFRYETVRTNVIRSMSYIDRDVIVKIFDKARVEAIAYIELFKSICDLEMEVLAAKDKFEPEVKPKTQEKEMTKLYKIVKDDEGKIIEKPDQFGEYIATDGEYMMLKMTSNACTSDKPSIQAFKPDQIEEVIPWTFQVTGGSIFTAKKDLVKVGDVLMSSDAKIVIVIKVDTRQRGEHKSFVGRRILTESIG